MAKKIVDATRGGVTLVGAELRVGTINIVTATPVPDKVVPYWIVYLELASGGVVLDRPMIEVEYVPGQDPGDLAIVRADATTLEGWDVTRMELTPGGEA